ncbi:ATP-binding protein [Asticcacaulis sp. W401b]|uniref:ATP-binding protein n=1 Tax=Asticcacaulis sp. W401b TaxID=3388666 RepID=UPI00397079F3
MKTTKSLANQIVGSTVLVTVSMLLVSILGVYFFYAVALTIAPHLVDMTATVPSSLDFLLLLGFCLLGLTVAMFVSARLARRIVLPLNSVADGAQRVASGDLTARAVPGDRTLGETAALVDNFNALAERLQKASDDLTLWNSLIAHELRTPVTILMGRLQGLRDGVFAPDPELFHSLHKQAEGLARLIEDLRTVSLFYGGSLRLNRQPTDLAAEMQSLALFLESRVVEAGFWLDLDLQRCIAEVDAARIRQGMLALIDNALKYADPCTLRLRLSASEEAIRISVTDQGPGMDDALAEIAFEAYQRGQPDQDTTRGMGIGLSAVRAIGEAHGGTASYSKDPSGHTFSLIIPHGRPLSEPAAVRL